MRRAAEAVLVGGTLGASVATLAAAFLAWTVGALSPGVGATSLALGMLAGAMAGAAAASVIPRDSGRTGPEGSAGTATADPSAPDSTGAPQDDGGQVEPRSGRVRSRADRLVDGLALLAFAIAAVRQFGWIAFERGGWI
ncbi:MAG TPA: hypothetical protein VGB87_16795, partial [Vicinamibacteria bacterium]